MRCSNDYLLQRKRGVANVLQQQIALGALAAIDAAVVLQHVADTVQADGQIFVKVFSAVAAYDLHLEASLYDLAFVSILEAVVFGHGSGTVLKLASLCRAALATNFDDRATLTGMRGGRGEGAVDRYVAERLQKIRGGLHVGALSLIHI